MNMDIMNVKIMKIWMLMYLIRIKTKYWTERRYLLNNNKNDNYPLRPIWIFSFECSRYKQNIYKLLEKYKQRLFIYNFKA